MGEPHSNITARLMPGVGAIDSDLWDRCAGTGDPFISHTFLNALEESCSVGPGTGWQPAPLIVDMPDCRNAGMAPAYLKSHSQGEYVFDHGWADAWTRAGGSYYPKLLIAVPFSPVPGCRLLNAGTDNSTAVGSALIAAAEAVVEQNQLSSAHATFIAPHQIPLFEASGWLIREDNQFHWHNPGYRTFEDFLGTLASAKRKNIRKERARATDGLKICRLTGSDIEEWHWDAFWQFYQDTGTRKWGRPYLTRPFFSLLGARMADQILLIFAMRDGIPIAGALNLIGSNTLYGRYWGCIEHVPHLHFELCYYQAIDFAIEHDLPYVQAGAQGGHKLVRGYLPVATWSAHYIAAPHFRAAVRDFLIHERRAVVESRDFLNQQTPFRHSD